MGVNTNQKREIFQILIIKLIFTFDLILKKEQSSILTRMQICRERGHSAIDYTGTQTFITILSYSLAKNFEHFDLLVSIDSV